MGAVSIGNLPLFYTFIKSKPLNEQRSFAVLKIGLITALRSLVGISNRQLSLKDKLINNFAFGREYLTFASFFTIHVVFDKFTKVAATPENISDDVKLILQRPW